MLTRSSGTKYILGMYEDLGPYGPYTTPTDIKSCDNFPTSLVDEHSMPTELSC